MGIDLETILGILFFVVFVILPMFGRKKRPDESDAPPARPEAGAPRRAAGEAQPGGARTATPPSGGQAGGRPAAAGTGTLEEVRERVRQAQQDEDARRTARRRTVATTAGQPAAQPPSNAPRQGTLVSGPPPGTLLGRKRGAPSASLGREGAQPQRQAGTSQRPAQASRQQASRRVPGGLGREGAPPSSMAPSVAPPIEVERRRSRTGAQRARAAAGAADALPPGAEAAARLDAPVLRTDREALVTGMIWHEVLSEPAAKRRLRRTRSRPLRP